MKPRWHAPAVLLALFEPEIRAWRGEAGLARAFWIYGVLTSLCLVLLYALALDAGRRDIQQGLLPVFALYTGWILVAVWRCAATAPPGW